jgi:ABC-type nitrate/sulfonate/bicarbonate transport system substrate-binding protein
MTLLLTAIALEHAGWLHAADTIRTAYSSVNPHALLVSLAEKRGLFTKYGLSSVVVYIPGGSTVVQTMMSGDIDLGQLTGAPGVAANLRGADIVYIAMTDDTMGYQIATRRDIKSPAELKGKRLGISRFASSSDFGTRTLLKRLGIDPKEVTILQIGNETERLAALKSGTIDGSVFNAPFGSVAKKFNFNILADAGALGIAYFNTGMCGSAKVLQKNEGRILNFMRAYLEAIKIFKTEPEYTLKALAQFSRVNDQELLKEAYEYNKNKIPDIPYPSVSAMQAVIDPLVEADPKLGKIDAKNYISDRFLKKLEEEGFVKKLMGR